MKPSHWHGIAFLPVTTTIVERVFLGDEDYQDYVAQQDVHDDFLMTWWRSISISTEGYLKVLIDKITEDLKILCHGPSTSICC